MRLKTLTWGLAVALLAAGWAVPGAQAGEGCCTMKGAKGNAKVGMVCTFDGKALKNCGFTDKRMSKTDKELFVCPEMDYCADKSGKCPTCGKKLRKKFCPMKEAGGKESAGSQSI